MVVKAAMVQFLLTRWGYDAKLSGNPDLAVEHIRSHKPSSSSANTLYVSDGAEQRLSDESEQHRKTRSSDSYACLEIETDRDKGRRENAAASSGTKADSETISALEVAYDAFQKLQSWEGKLKDALLGSITLEEFLALGSEMFHRPIAYFDRNLIVLGASPDYWKRGQEGPESPGGIDVDGQMPPNLAIDLLEDIDYLHAAEEQGGFYYISNQQRVFYGINTFDAGEYLARLVFSLSEGEQRLHRGEEQLIDVFHSYLDELHLRYAGNAQVVSSQNDALHVLVRTVLLGIESKLQDESGSVLESFGWAQDDFFMISKLVFFEGVHWDTASLYLCNLLERMMPRSCAFPESRQIVWTIDLTRAAQPGETLEQLEHRITKSLVSILRNYACKAGLSNGFQQFSNARSHYIEADRALEVGQVRNPHSWYYRFGDYAFNYVLSRCVEELPAELVCHPALAALIAHDAQHATDYSRTLTCFLRNSQNTTHASDELFIHRTSFMRRMAHIQELTGVRLDDPDEVLHLMLSARLLGM